MASKKSGVSRTMPSLNPKRGKPPRVSKKSARKVVPKSKKTRAKEPARLIDPYTTNELLDLRARLEEIQHELCHLINRGCTIAYGKWKKKVVRKTPERWVCDNCGHTLSVKNWTYSQCVHNGTPICTECDTDMKYEGV